jgi:hypothetical protein
MREKAHLWKMNTFSSPFSVSAQVPFKSTHSVKITKYYTERKNEKETMLFAVLV